MNPRQRRGALFIMTAALLGVIAFTIVAGRVSEVNREVGDRIVVYRAARPIPPFEALSEENLEPVEIPERWTAPTSRLRFEDLRGRKISFPVEAGTILSGDMLVPPSRLSATEREVAINVSAVTGIGGRVAPGAQVDIYAVFGDVAGLTKQVRVLVRNVRVVSVGGRETVRGEDDETGVISDRAVIPVTLALEPDDALAVTYANAFADEVRLVGLPTGELNRAAESDVFDAQNLGGEAVPEGDQ